MAVTVTHRQQMDLIVAVLCGLGAREEDAHIQADVWTEADLRGIPSHGVQRLPVMATRIRKGLLKAEAKPEKTWSTGAVLNIDGKDGFGTAACELGLRELLPAVRQNGVGVLTVRNAAHIGMVGYYAERRAREGFCCLAFTTTEVLVHPYGGAEALVGTNPVAIGIPANPRPFVLDMATAVGAMGKIIAMKHRGERIPEGWAVDKDGRPTTDPEEAMHGSLSPAGGPKGYGLGIAIAMLSGLVPGAEIGRKVLGTLDTEHRCTIGDLFIVLDPKAFPGADTLLDGVKEYLDELRASRPAVGVNQVRVPGDREVRIREERLKNGIPHPEEVWHAAEQLRATIDK
ncbi:MAG TPA: Ldh family oxidoreductase [Terriglobia bacterium]|nr:Ldh family oxidoreductase [Terriglobia bacterium]